MCPHAQSSWVGIVTNDPTGKASKAHMSEVTCGRSVCVDKAVKRVEKFTRESARLHTYAELRTTS